MSNVNIPNHEQWKKMNEYLNTIAVLLASNDVDYTPKKIEPGEKLTAGLYSGFALLTTNGETAAFVVPSFLYKAPQTCFISLAMNFSLMLYDVNGEITWSLIEGVNEVNTTVKVDLYLVKLIAM